MFKEGKNSENVKDYLKMIIILNNQGGNTNLRMGKNYINSRL